MSQKSWKVRIYTRFRHWSFLSALIAAFQKPAHPKKWVFVIGCYNSGTTLLAELLAQHPALTVLPDEGVMLTNQLKRPEDYQWRRMWHRCLDQLQAANQKLDRRAAKLIKKHWAFFVPSSSKIIVEKSIANILRVDFLQAHFQDAYFIHIQRDPYAVAEGIRRKAKPMGPQAVQFGRQYPLDLCTRQWVASQQVFEQVKPKIKNLLMLDYESFTQAPVQSAQRITDFLDIVSFKPSIFEGAIHVHGQSRPISNQNGESYQKLSVSDWSLINQLAGATIQQYGYYKAEKPA